MGSTAVTVLYVWLLDRFKNLDTDLSAVVARVAFEGISRIFLSSQKDRGHGGSTVGTYDLEMGGLQEVENGTSVDTSRSRCVQSLAELSQSAEGRDALMILLKDASENPELESIFASLAKAPMSGTAGHTQATSVNSS